MGYQAIQCSHAVREFVEEFPAADRSWRQESNSIILVTCSDIGEFRKILTRADAAGILHVEFSEPDIGYQPTASCFVPSEGTAHLLRHCQLLGSRGRDVQPDDPRTLLDYRALMKATRMGNTTVWQHGQDCCDVFRRILAGERLPRMERIAWLDEAVRSFSPGMTDDVMTYLLFHDIGKTVTSDGSGSFPGHAAASARIWRSVDGREHIARWMEHDMTMHSGTREAALATPDRFILRLTAVAELYANAQSFGGYDSDSFKIKHKKITRNGA